MSISEYDEQIVCCFNKYLLDYFNNTDTINAIKNRDFIIHQGFQTFLHILSILYVMGMKTDQLNSYLEKCPLLFVEYTEQVYLKQSENLHTPSMFVYNVLLGSTTMQEYKCNNSQFMNKLMKWSHILFIWEHRNITIENRKYFLNNFLQPYLLLFTNDDCFYTYIIFENIQNSLLHKTNCYEIYSYLLTSFLNHFSKKKKSLTHDNVKSIHFNKFMEEKETYDEKIENITNLKHMDGLIKWIFSN